MAYIHETQSDEGHQHPSGWDDDFSLMELSEAEDQMTFCDVDFLKTFSWKHK